MISPDKIDEWIREVEERPTSAVLIIRYIANRLSELAAREEELAAENIELLNGRKVEEYENRIASLEYQLDLLKRQLGGEVILPTEVPGSKSLSNRINLLLFSPNGQVLRIEFDPDELSQAQPIAKLQGEPSVDNSQLNLLATSAQEELLLIFDSGRTVTYPVSRLPEANQDTLTWEQAFVEEPRIKEELAAIYPIAKMSLYETCIQASRRGYVKKMKSAFFTSHLAENFIGTGVKLPADKTCGITFAARNDLFVMVSQEGFVFSMPAESLPTAIEEVIRLGIKDHIVSAFVTSRKPELLFITQNGKVVHRDVGWLEEAKSFKSGGQALLSKERREAGIRIAGAAPVEDTDWIFIFKSDNTITAHQVGSLVATGSVPGIQTSGMVTSISAFNLPAQEQR